MVLMSKYSIPAMEKNEGLQCRGSIVNIASVAGIRGGNPHLLYPTSKGAIVVRPPPFLFFPFPLPSILRSVRSLRRLLRRT